MKYALIAEIGMSIPLSFCEIAVYEVEGVDGYAPMHGSYYYSSGNASEFDPVMESNYGDGGKGLDIYAGHPLDPIVDAATQGTFPPGVPPVNLLSTAIQERDKGKGKRKATWTDKRNQRKGTGPREKFTGNLLSDRAAPMTVVFAGNTTVQVRTYCECGLNCQPAKCRLNVVQEWQQISAGSMTAAQCELGAGGPGPCQCLYPMYELPPGHCPTGPFGCDETCPVRPHEDWGIGPTDEYEYVMCNDYTLGVSDCWGDDVWWSVPQCKYQGVRGREGAVMNTSAEREVMSLTQCIDAGGDRWEDPNGLNVYREYFYEEVKAKYPVYNQNGVKPTRGCTLDACKPWGRAFELSGILGVNNQTLKRVKRAGMYVFNWTDDEAWEVPMQYDDVEIPCNWTVTLDKSSMVLATLSIRGTLRFMNNAVEPLTLHAHIINILGGKLIVGENKYGVRMPFEGPMATIMLHGDVYNWGKECPTCGKKIFVSGELILEGKERQVVRRLAQDAEPGMDVIVLAGEPVDWEVGDQIVLTAVTSEQHPLNVYPNDGGRTPKFNGKPVGHVSEKCEKYNGNCMQEIRKKRVGSGTHGNSTVNRFYIPILILSNLTPRPNPACSCPSELVLISHISEDGHTVYLQNQLQYFHAGTMVNEGGVIMDARDTVALLTRNVEIRGGNSGMFDELRGDVAREEQMYGFTIHGEAGGTLGGSWESPTADTGSEQTPDTDAIFGVPQPPFKFPCGPRNYYQTASPVDVIEGGTAVFANMPSQPAPGACECWPGGPNECCGCKLPPARIDIKYVTLREGGKQWSTKPNKGRDLNWIQYPTFWANSDQVGLAATYGSTLNLTGVVSGTPHTGTGC